MTASRADTPTTVTVDDLVGAWTLVSAVQTFDDGEQVPEFGPTADGYIIYTADGSVSATLGDASRPRSGATDPQRATDGQLAAMAQRFIAYAGPFTLDEDTGTVTHHIVTSLFTDWQAGEQRRRVRIENGLLHEAGTPREAPDGRRFTVELRWRRVPAG